MHRFRNLIQGFEFFAMVVVDEDLNNFVKKIDQDVSRVGQK